ncbi:FG-GAP-like repeat-containing protein [uncultured Lacinutrix sp.]|uniref:FG-GAP-like repeat-containing protein n=1 Tax=uncultured Lacinutrix sp. TaxID=574032 RepID=UPI0026379268|nr:FG-GAP-like repeat-containing protein [uncultured Lacinutrix sp.]
MKKITLLTLCFVFALTVKAQTYLSENFDTTIPSSWIITDAGEATGDSWTSGMKNGNALNGTNAAIVDSDGVGDGTILFETLTSPIVDTSGATALYLEFHQFFNNFGADVAIVEVYDGTNWVEILNQTADAGAFNNPDIQQIDITAYKNANMQVRFIYNDNDVWAWYWLIDNVSIYNTSCAGPTNTIVTNITQNTATIDWTAGGSETSWEIIVQLTGQPQPLDTDTGTVVTTTTYNVTGLIAGTSYDVYVRSYCGVDDGYSTWGAARQFETASIPAPISFTQSPITTTGTIRAVVDMNGDHLDDIVAVNSTNIHIQEQQVGGGFAVKNITTTNADFTPSWSLAAADWDGNGYTDLLYGAGSGVTFMKADNATGTSFTEISGSQNVFSQRSNFIDINNDGNLDAFVCHDVAPNVYYINDGSGNLTFHQTTNAGAPYNLGDYVSGGNYGSIWIDYDNDRDQDMFIAKCGGEVARRTNQMHTNNGLDANGITTSFTENGVALNLADPMQTWSSAWGDFDNDGDMDVFVGASSGTHKLMRNDLVLDTNGDLVSVTFTEVTGTSGVSSLTATGIENVTFDFDNDGNLDIASNGNILFGNGDLTFTSYENVVAARGSFGDLNNDGFIDNFSETGTLYTNNTNSNNWIKINTVGTASNLDGIGARIILETASGTQIRDVRSGDGFRFMNTLNAHFGIGADTAITSITIHWPSGMTDFIENPNINEPLEVVEGSSPLSVAAFSVEDLILYPNPATTVLNLNGTDYLFDNTKYSIFDMVGRMVANGNFNSNSIDISKLQSGNYILQISANRSVKTQKFIKK